MLVPAACVFSLPGDDESVFVPAAGVFSLPGDASPVFVPVTGVFGLSGDASPVFVPVTGVFGLSGDAEPVSVPAAGVFAFSGDARPCFRPRHGCFSSFRGRFTYVLSPWNRVIMVSSAGWGCCLPGANLSGGVRAIPVARRLTPPFYEPARGLVTVVISRCRRPHDTRRRRAAPSIDARPVTASLQGSREAAAPPRRGNLKSLSLTDYVVFISPYI